MIPLFKVHMPSDVMAPLQETLFSGYIGEGPRVKDFEAALAAYVGNPNVLTLNSGTSAIQLALRLANVGPGDEVISTSMTCTASNEPIMAAGARIVWADIDPGSGNIDPATIEAKITPRTRAIVVVDWGGYPVDLDEVMAIAARHGLKVIEDAAHAFGAEYKGTRTGCHADFVCFSFQAIKHITTVDGGALFCRSEADCKRGRLLRWYGIDRDQPRKDFRCEEDIVEWGYKFHMNDVNATIGLVQLKYLDGILKQRRELAAYYDRELAGARGARLCSWKADRVSAFWLYTILVENRQAFMNWMKECNIAVSQVHARNDKHTMFKDFRAPLPGVDQFTRDMVCIPIGFWIGKEEREHIVASIKQGW
ncbi:MAG TPA: DegT/DnrJ/EryC1/StrS family aminotransferase [Myxococcales bacterium]|nr:DegT/DnrJ/EryC1/StrS family aminotransferase [Myxococcales bacterium]